MGVDTKGLLNKEVSVLEIATLIETFAKDVSVDDNGRDYYSVIFTYEGEVRRLSVFTPYASERLNGEIITYISLGCYGFANEIMHRIVSYFGGQYIHDDCSGDAPVYLAKTSDYQESAAVKADKEVLALMADYNIPSLHKFTIMRFVRENAETLIEISKRVE